MAGTRIENLYDMTYALQDHKPGETVDVVVLRDGAARHAARDARLAWRSSRLRRPRLMARLPQCSRSRPASRSRRRSTARSISKDIRQLTFGGENAEAYFSPDGKKLIYQSTAERGGCDQQYVLDLATGETKLVSSGKGRTTCGYFSYPTGDRIIYASTEAGDAGCPPPPDRSRGYIWGVYQSFDIYIAKADGTDKKRITTAPGYDAEATWCHKGGKIIFTSVRDGDLDLYEMDENGGNVQRLTSTPGYDGGAFYNADCTRDRLARLALRRSAGSSPTTRRCSREGFVRPSKMELYVANADGTRREADHQQRRRELRPVLHAGRQAHHLLLERARPARPRVRHLHRRQGRQRRAGAHHHRAGLRRLPDVQPRRQVAGVGVEPREPEGRETNCSSRSWPQ